MGKKFPSQIRYEENNPTITFRLKKEFHQSIANEVSGDWW